MALGPAIGLHGAGVDEPQFVEVGGTAPVVGVTLSALGSPHHSPAPVQARAVESGAATDVVHPLSTTEMEFNQGEVVNRRHAHVVLRGPDVGCLLGVGRLAYPDLLVELEATAAD